MAVHVICYDSDSISGEASFSDSYYESLASTNHSTNNRSDNKRGTSPHVSAGGEAVNLVAFLQNVYKCRHNKLVITIGRFVDTLSIIQIHDLSADSSLHSVSGDTPFHIAARVCNKEIFEELLKKLEGLALSAGVHSNEVIYNVLSIKNNDGLTVADVAKQNGAIVILEVCKKYGVSPDIIRIAWQTVVAHPDVVEDLEDISDKEQCDQYKMAQEKAIKLCYVVCATLATPHSIDSHMNHSTHNSTLVDQTRYATLATAISNNDLDTIKGCLNNLDAQEYINQVYVRKHGQAYAPFELAIIESRNNILKWFLSFHTKDLPIQSVAIAYEWALAFSCEYKKYERVANILGKFLASSKFRMSW